MKSNPIGVFDSGVGGLSILAHLRRLLPGENILYFADQAHVPYGPRAMLQIREFSKAITTYLRSKGAKIIVVACNTASAAALHHLRKLFPKTPFVGMEPAVKPAARRSKNQKVGVLATPATFQGELFGSVVERFASGVEIRQQTLRGLVERIEAADLDGPKTRMILEQKITPLVENGVDTLVLACTHYAFVIPTIEELFGSSITVIDPSPAIARQTKRLLYERGIQVDDTALGEITYISTSDADQLASKAVQLIHIGGKPRNARWDNLKLRD
jgi:glutamate racemase